MIDLHSGKLSRRKHSPPCLACVLRQARGQSVLPDPCCQLRLVPKTTLASGLSQAWLALWAFAPPLGAWPGTQVQSGCASGVSPFLRGKLSFLTHSSLDRLPGIACLLCARGCVGPL